MRLIQIKGVACIVRMHCRERTYVSALFQVHNRQSENRWPKTNHWARANTQARPYVSVHFTVSGIDP
jgi:hypothetical protein